MATYLPVLLVSVNAGMPDDASLQPLPRGQVDYLSHDWDEEDVWRSWRNMTKQKNEIANGIRLENASWRTWWKQRNRLKTVSPEALNWLKDSDVTWLYGPLHTAVDWIPLGNAPMTPPNGLASMQKKDKTPVSIKPSNCISSPSSSINLDRYNTQVSRYGLGEHHSPQPAMKPILKHRSIAEMLSSTLPPTSSWADDDATSFPLGDVEEETETEGGNMNLLGERRSSFGGKSGRPAIFHTKSDTHLLPRFDRKKMRSSPPRVDPSIPQQEPDNCLSESQRIHASNDLAELAWNATATSVPIHSVGWSSGTQTQPPQMIENSESSGSEPGSGRSEIDVVTSSPNIGQVPSKKHISFNAIVEQCIAIDSMSAPLSPSILEEETWPGFEDGYAVDDEGGLYESIRSNRDYDSDDQIADEDDDDVLEIKPPSHRGSIDGIQDQLTFRESVSSSTSGISTAGNPKRPPLHHSSTSKSFNRNRSNRGLRSGSRRSSLSTSQNRSRSSLGGVSEREHVSIAPIAPTILKTGGTESGIDDVLYVGTTSLLGNINQPGIRGSSSSLSNTISSGNFAGGLYASYGYGYGGYGYGEQVSEGRSEAYEHFERGTEAGGLVYQSPNGNVYPWEETDALRYRMRSEYGIPSPATSPPDTSLSPVQMEVKELKSSNLNFLPENHSVFGRTPAPPLRDSEFEHLNVILPAMKSQGDVETVFNEILTSCDDRDERMRLTVPVMNGGADSINQQSPADGAVGRTPSPDFQPKINPRIASLKSEGSYRSPSSTTITTAAPDHVDEMANVPITQLHPADSLKQQSDLLSPLDASPDRGRSISTSPVSGYLAPNVSRPIPDNRRDSRSDSRGRSRTRSSISTSDQEIERGRSRSRSTASGANSPMSDSSSPHTRYPPMVIGIGGHSGREVRDGRGTRLYRKTSEDFMGTSSSSSPSSSSPRVRNRDGRRVSESLSPPVGTGNGDILSRSNTISSSYSNLRSMPSSGLGLQSYVAKADDSLDSGHSFSEPKSSVVRVSEPVAPVIGRGASGDSMSSTSSCSSSTSINGRLLPPSIPEEDERLKAEAQGEISSQKASQPPPRTQNKTEAVASQHKNNRLCKFDQTNSVGSGQCETPPALIWQPRTKANDLVTSARSFIGSIWNGSST